MTTTPHQLRNGDFLQNWSGTSGLLTADSWAAIASIVGYRGDGLTNSTATNPQTTLADGDGTPINLINASSSASATGGIHEINDDVVALQGSGTADAPHLVIYLDTTDVQNVNFTATLRELDSSTTDQRFAVQYRVGGVGNYIDLPAGAVSGVFNAAGNQTVSLNVTLPPAANNNALVEIRIITNDAPGNDAMIGIDDINITSEPLVADPVGTLNILDASIAEGDSGASALVFTVNRDGGDNGAVSATWTLNLDTADAADLGPGQLLTGTVSFADGQTSATITVQIAGDVAFEPNETFTVTLSEPLGGVGLGDAAATGTILNDDPAPPAGVFINEIHYDDAGTDIGEAIEVAGPAGTSLAGWRLVLYNGNGGAPYATINLSGTIPNQDDGYGTLSFAGPGGGIQNGSPDGVALVDAGGTVIQFLSYEGVILATDGPADGMTSIDIGVAEEPAVADGFSLQLVGSGASYDDFHWVDARDDNFGSVNTDQDFIGPNATGLVTIGDVSLVEGDSGTQLMTFTIRRGGGLAQTASVDWQLALTGSADAADLGPGQPLSGHVDFGPGVSAVQITVAIQGDTIGEDNETFQILLVNPVGNISITDGTGIGTIVNDDPVPRAIYEIQGEGHLSAYDGQPVLTTGIVTSVVFNGFYLQDPTGDGNARTSDGIFVFTGGAPAVAVGDSVQVTGSVNEFQPGALGLSITEIEAFGPGAITVQSSGNALPAALVIGTGGVLPPTSVIDDDGLVYDPENDGIDFYESLEGMLVTVDAPLVVHNSTTQFGETFVVASGGDGATGINARGGITISDGDMNPERIMIVADDGQVHTQGDRLADVTGIMTYGFDHYRVLATDPVVVTTDVTVSRESTLLDGGRDHLTVASYNVQNLGPDDTAQKFDLLADDIVFSLSAPDIIAVQEMQDGNGLNGTDPLSAEVTAQMLIDAIVANGGPQYVYVEIAPATAGSTGGEPGGNIRNGFFYNPDRVSLVAGSLSILTDPAFDGSRKPLVGTFTFNGEEVTLINVHFTARLGGPPAWGAEQPAADAGDGSRTAQATAVGAYVNDALATDPDLNFGVLGDFNGFWFENAVAALEAGAVMTDLHRLLPEEERYSARFDGNAQGIDHIVVTGGLLDGAAFDAVHRNAEQPFGVPIGTDHDPIIARFFIEHPNEAPLDLVIDDAAIDENAPAGTLIGTVSADDPDNDVLVYTLVDDAGGLFDLDASTGALTSTAPLNHEADDSYTIVVRATDPDGLFVERTIDIAVNDLNEAPAAGNDSAAVNEDATTPNLWTQLLANDSDPDDGDSLTITAVNTTGTRGSVLFDPGTQSLRYVADHDSFDDLDPGETYVDSFTYTVTDEGGLTSTATVSVTVTGIADGVTRTAPLFGGTVNGTGGEDTLIGLLGNDTLNGLGGHDTLFGALGNDKLFGGDGNDYLVGGLGDDKLEGGAGNDDLNGGINNDRLTGGTGADRFHAELAGGKDVVTDYQSGVDSVVLDFLVNLKSSKVQDTNSDGIQDLVLTFTGGSTMTLLGINNVNLVTFERADDLSGLPLF